jgi:hypothetical protein
MTTRKTQVREHVIADMSLHHLAFLIVSCGFTIRQMHADYGYDLSIFTFDEAGRYENGSIFVQIKATDRLRVDPATREIKFRISKRDILTWESESLPAYLVVFDATACKAYAIYLQQYFARAGISSATMTGASVEVRLPGREVDAEAIQGWRAAKNAVLRQMGAVKHD